MFIMGGINIIITYKATKEVVQIAKSSDNITEFITEIDKRIPKENNVDNY